MLALASTTNPCHAALRALVGTPSPDPDTHRRNVGRALESLIAAAVGRKTSAAAGKALAGLGLVAATPDLLADAYQSALSWGQPSIAGARRARGVFYTPAPLVEHVLDLALNPILAETDSPLVLDPSCGGGAFLVAAARRIARASGRSLAHVIRHSIAGIDIDPAAIALARFTLWYAARLDPAAFESCAPGVVVGDALQSRSWNSPPTTRSTKPYAKSDQFDWAERFPRAATQHGFHAVIGNPPFLNQLRSATTTSRENAAFLKHRFEGRLAGYADAASAFLLLALELTRPGGRAALVQPMSLLAGRDTKPVRDFASSIAALEALWIAGQPVFDAGVFTCVPVLHRGAAQSRVRITLGLAGTPSPDATLEPRAQTWSALAAHAAGVPALTVKESRTLADIAHATADFRDEYYALRGRLREHPAKGSPVVTVGLVDLAVCHWGSKPTRILLKKWNAPVAQLQGQSLGLPRLRRRLVPKVLVATQTRTIEAFVDTTGQFIPVTPLLTVTPRGDTTLWHLAAAIASPVLAALALRHRAGAGLSPDVIKLSAAQLLELPVPSDSKAWSSAAQLFEHASATHDHAERQGVLARYASVITAAYSLSAATQRTVLDWWLARRAPRTRRRTLPA